MGTRNLTQVKDINGEVKISQYGQWDGYPSGQGLTILNFIKEEGNLSKLSKSIENVRFYDYENMDNNTNEMNTLDNNIDNNIATPKQKHIIKTFISRDVGGEILQNVIDHTGSVNDPIILMDRSSTAMNDGWVEWSYIINLQEEKLYVHGQIDCDPIKVYDFSNLPTNTEFVNELDMLVLGDEYENG